MTVKEDVTAFLSAERNGQKLGSGLVKVIVTYLVDVVDVSNVQEVKLKSLKDTAKEAWKDQKDGSMLPIMHMDSLTAWLASTSVVDELNATSRQIKGGEVQLVTEDEERLFPPITRQQRA